MNCKHNLSELFFALMILFCGLISPSNGVDDKVNKSAIELLSTMSTIVLLFFIIYILTDVLDKFNKKTI